MVETVNIGTWNGKEVFAEVTNRNYVDLYVDGYDRSIAMWDFEYCHENHKDITDVVQPEQCNQAEIIYEVLRAISRAGNWRDIIIGMAALRGTQGHHRKNNLKQTQEITGHSMTLHDLLFLNGEAEC